MWRAFAHFIPFAILILALAGCQGISSFDLSTADNINGGLGEGYDVAFEFVAQPVAEGSLVIALYSDGTTRAAGYGFITKHPVDDYYFVQLDFTVDLGSGQYDRANYHAFVFASPYQPEVVGQYISPAGIAEISYNEEAGQRLQLLWTAEHGLPTVPVGSILEVTEYYEVDGEWRTNWSNVCYLEPVMSSAWCRLYGIGGVEDTDWSNVTIRVVE